MMTTGGRSQLIIFGPSDLSDTTNTSDNSDYSFFTMSLFTSIYSFRNKKRNRDKKLHCNVIVKYDRRHRVCVFFIVKSLEGHVVECT